MSVLRRLDSGAKSLCSGGLCTIGQAEETIETTGLRFLKRCTGTRDNRVVSSVVLSGVPLRMSSVGEGVAEKEDSYAWSYPDEEEEKR
jgi:hypothetical protein